MDRSARSPATTTEKPRISWTVQAFWPRCVEERRTAMQVQSWMKLEAAASYCRAAAAVPGFLEAALQRPTPVPAHFQSWARILVPEPWTTVAKHREKQV